MNNKRLWNRTLPLALAVGLASAAAAHAQNPVTGKPAVEVDTTVLDQLGPPSNLPEMLLQHTPFEAERIVLTPPKGVKPPAAPVKAGKGQKRRLNVPEAAPTPPESEVVHLHPIKPRAAKPAKTAVPAPAPAAAKEAAPASLTPTLAPSTTPVTSEPLPPPGKSKSAVATPVPAPAAAPPPAQTQPQAPAATPPTPPPAAQPAPAGSAAVALTAQPAAPEPAPAAPAQEALSTIRFDKESARLPDGARDLLAHLASRMTEDATLEVQLLAYAAGDEENASKARRLSLSRALAVRSFLIDQGVRSTRIEVRALGNKVPEGEPDRVDIAMQKRG